MDLAIYGAQSIALGTWEAIHHLYPSKNIRCFVVTKREMNGELLSGIPVVELESLARLLSAEEKEKLQVLIATPEAVMAEIEENLDIQGLRCHVRLTSSRWSELMGYYYTYQRNYMPLHALPVGFHRADMHVFVARFYRDQPLTEKYDMPKWAIPIQAGAALCEERIADIVDCEGENISAKNGNYSELTALYWVWKHCLSNHEADKKFGSKFPNFELMPAGDGQGDVKYEYYGLAHYRRMLELTEDDVLRLVDNDVDVVLPYPMPYEPDMEAHHKRYVKKADWEAVLMAVSQLHPEYAKVFNKIQKQRFLYHYNIMVAKKEILKEYCNWLFPILERVEELSIPRGAERADRYIGYVGESLTTLYFMAHKDKLNIVHAGCRFLI